MPRVPSGFSSCSSGFSGRRCCALLLVGAIASQFATPLVAAQSDEPPAPRPNFALPAAATAIQSPSQANDGTEAWRKEVEAAKLRRTNGRQMEAGGFLLGLGGDIAAAFIATHCRGGCAAAAPVGLTSIGAGIWLGFVGRARVQDANVEITALLTRGPHTESSVAVPLGTSSPISVTVGQTTGISYRVRW